MLVDLFVPPVVVDDFDERLVDLLCSGLFSNTLSNSLFYQTVGDVFLMGSPTMEPWGPDGGFPREHGCCRHEVSYVSGKCLQLLLNRGAQDVDVGR